MIISTRTMLSQRRLLFVVAILCMLVAAVVGMHSGGSVDASDACAIAGLVCALAVALVAPLCVRAFEVELRVPGRTVDGECAPRRAVGVSPSALGLAELCCLRV